MMLLSGETSYLQKAKEFAMIDLHPLSTADKYFPSPRVLNTHYRLDVLPKTFRDAKTVLGKAERIFGNKSGIT